MSHAVCTLEEGGGDAAVLDPGADPAVEEPDLLHTCVHQPPGKTSRGHRAVGLGSVDHDMRIRLNAKTFQRVEQFATF